MMQKKCHSGCLYCYWREPDDDVSIHQRGSLSSSAMMRQPFCIRTTADRKMRGWWWMCQNATTASIFKKNKNASSSEMESDENDHDSTFSPGHFITRQTKWLRWCISPVSQRDLESLLTLRKKTFASGLRKVDKSLGNMPSSLLCWVPFYYFKQLMSAKMYFSYGSFSRIMRRGKKNRE